MANSSSKDAAITVIVTLNIKPEHVVRALELWDEQISDIESTGPLGDVKYAIFRNNSIENEFTVVQTFASDAVREAFMKKPKHEEISAKVFGEGLIDGEPEARYCTLAAGTRS